MRIRGGALLFCAIIIISGCNSSASLKKDGSVKLDSQEIQVKNETSTADHLNSEEPQITDYPDFENLAELNNPDLKEIIMIGPDSEIVIKKKASTKNKNLVYKNKEKIEQKKEIQTQKDNSQTANFTNNSENTWKQAETVENNTSATTTTVQKFQITQTEDVAEELKDKNLDLTQMEKTQIIENPVKNIEAMENDELIISLPESGWIIKNISVDLVRPIRRFSESGNTGYVFQTNGSGKVQILFIRYQTSEDRIIRQTCRITIKPRVIAENKNKQTTEKKDTAVKKQNKIEKKEKEDLEKTLANDLFNQKKYDDAKIRYLALIEKGKPDAEIYYKLGIISKSEQNKAEAMDYFQKNLSEKDNPFFSHSLIELLQIMKEESKFQDAINLYYQNGIKGDIDESKREELSLILPDIYFNMKDFKTASLEYRRFIETFPDSVSTDKALFYLAYSTESLKINPDYKEAYRIYQELIKNYPESRYVTPSKNRMLYLERHYLKIN